MPGEAAVRASGRWRRSLLLPGEALLLTGVVVVVEFGRLEDVMGSWAVGRRRGRDGDGWLIGLMRHVRGGWRCRRLGVVVGLQLWLLPDSLAASMTLAEHAFSVLPLAPSTWLMKSVLVASHVRHVLPTGTRGRHAWSLSSDGLHSKKGYMWIGHGDMSISNAKQPSRLAHVHSRKDEVAKQLLYEDEAKQNPGL